MVRRIEATSFLARGVITPRVEFHVAESGDGPPVLLLSGAGGWRLTFESLATELADDFHVVGVDPPGQGESRILSDEATFDVDAIVDALRDLLDALGIERVAFVAHSWGGGYALRFAQKHPDRVDRVVAIAPAGLGDVRDPWEFRMLRIPGIGEILTRLPPIRVARRLLRKSLAVVSVADRLPAFQSMARSPAGRNAWRHDMLLVERSVEWGRTDEGLESVECPVLLLWGEKDKIFDAGLLDALFARLPNSSAVLLRGAGHAAHDDRPDVARRRIRAFLDPGRLPSYSYLVI
jgi:pimeloyl-ACP methyl ester carboxylesterase